MGLARQTRILIVDDSAVMRSLLRSVVSSDPNLEVAGTAADGEAALGSLDSLHPDLVLLDVEMPVMDGLATLRELRRRGHKMPVIVCSALTQRGAKVTLEALASGASDYVAKPTGQSNRETAAKALGLDLRPKIYALARMRLPAQTRSNSSLFSVTAPLSPGLSQSPAAFSRVQLARDSAISSHPTVLAIGVSTGEPAALDVLLPQFPADFPLPVLVVQHMPELFTKVFAERLNGRLPVARARSCRGRRGEGRNHLHRARKLAHRGAAGRLRRCAADAPIESRSPGESLPSRRGRLISQRRRGVWRRCAGGGLDGDGVRRHAGGCRVLREHGGAVLAQDEASSTVWLIFYTIVSEVIDYQHVAVFKMV